MTTLPSSRVPSRRRLASRRRLRLRRAWAGSTRRAIQAVAVAAVLVVLVGAAWPMPTGPSLVLGMALLVWLVGTFALEDPGQG